MIGRVWMRGEAFYGAQLAREPVTVSSMLGLPRWFVVGVLIGLVVAGFIALVFLFATLRYPDTGPRDGRGRGDDRRRTEITQYLRTIGEQVVEGYDLDGQRVEIYLPVRDVAITFNARAFFALEQSDTDVVLVEAEMPISHLAVRLPFDVPTFTDTRSENDAIRTAYALLDVPIHADEAEIRTAYHEKVKVAHPDGGGSREAFQRVREAYMIATEDARRRQTSDTS